MSALPPKADMCGATAHVCFGPIADIPSRSIVIISCREVGCYIVSLPTFGNHMNFLSRYIRYLKDNPERYWFKRTAHGWGWVPATWQGWLTFVVFLGIFLWLFLPFVNGPVPTGTETFWFLTKVLVWVAALIGVAYLTGESPKWQWGIPEGSDRRD
jgi:hypothetical protein